MATISQRPVLVQGDTYLAVEGGRLGTVVLDYAALGGPPPSTTTATVSISTPSYTTVSSASALQQALDAGVLDIALDADITAPAGGINVPRLSGGRILRCIGNGILRRGSSLTGNVLRSDGTGGSLTLLGFRVDGGWRSDMRELSDSDSNYFLPDYNFLRLQDCVTCYSKRTGYLVAGSFQVEIVNCTAFAICRDHCWADRVRDLLVQGCLIQHCGDDSLGTHQLIGQGLITQSIRFIGNTIRDGLGGKLHCGAADGTYNGKQSQILYDGNTFEACGLYGVHGHEPPPGQDHNTSQPHNVIIRNNIVRDLRKTTPVSPGQEIGVAWRFSFPDFSYDSSFTLTGNSADRRPSLQGQPLSAGFNWPVPANVPGASSFAGQFFSKTGFGAFTFDLASQGTLFQGSNSGSITHSGNTFTGSGWTSTIS